MRKLTIGILLLILYICVFFRPAGAESLQTPGDAVLGYLSALQKGDAAGADRHSVAKLPVSDWTLNTPMLELVYPSITEIAVEGTAISGDTAVVTVSVTHADWAIVQKSDWFQQMYYDFNNWEILYDQVDENGRTSFEYILDMAKRMCLIREKAAYTTVLDRDGWRVDLDATARQWKAETETQDTPKVTLESFGFIEHDYAQQRYYNDLEYSNQGFDTDYRMDWTLWLRLKADDNADIDDLQRYSAYTLHSDLIAADELPVDFAWTDGSCEWYTRYSMADIGWYAAVEAKPLDQDMTAAAIAHELQVSTFTCQAEYWPLSFRCYHMLQQISTSNTVYDARGFDGQAAAVFSCAKPAAPGTADTTLEDYLYQEGKGCIKKSDVRELWPGLVNEALSGGAEGYTLYTITGTLSRETALPMYDVTFQLMDETEGVWVRRAEQCGMCYSIDGCDLVQGDCREVSFDILVRPEGLAPKGCRSGCGAWTSACDFPPNTSHARLNRIHQQRASARAAASPQI